MHACRNQHTLPGGYEKLMVNPSFGLWPKQKHRKVGWGIGQDYLPSQHCSKHAAIFNMPNTTRPAYGWNKEKANKVSEFVPCASTCHLCRCVAKCDSISAVSSRQPADCQVCANIIHGIGYETSSFVSMTIKLLLRNSCAVRCW